MKSEAKEKMTPEKVISDKVSSMSDNNNESNAKKDLSDSEHKEELKAEQKE